MATLVRPKKKWMLTVPIRQFGAGPNHSGSKYRKKHERAAGPPGTPQGACIFHTTRSDRKTCRCGGHNGQAL